MIRARKERREARKAARYSASCADVAEQRPSTDEAMPTEAKVALENVAEPVEIRGSGSEACRVFSNPSEIAQDLSILHGLAANSRWIKLKKRRQRWLYQRLFKIIEKPTVLIPHGEGVFDSESDADKNAMKAMQILSILESQNQKDEHKIIDVKNPQAGSTVNVGVQVDVSKQVQELIKQPEYLEWLRDQERRKNSNSSLMG